MIFAWTLNRNDADRNSFNGMLRIAETKQTPR
jgi:hypothetical protein